MGYTYYRIEVRTEIIRFIARPSHLTYRSRIPLAVYHPRPAGVLCVGFRIVVFLAEPGSCNQLTKCHAAIPSHAVKHSTTLWRILSHFAMKKVTHGTKIFSRGIV